MVGQRYNYGKRSYSQRDYVDNRVNKRRNPHDDKDRIVPGPEDTVYRYLCQARKIGNIIGKGGEIVKQLRDDSQAKIRIGERMLGSEERVVTVFSSSKETNTFAETGDHICPAQDALFRVHERHVTEEASGDEENDTGSCQVTVRLLVPSDQIGCIIGKGGQIIQFICSETGAQIRFVKNDRLPPCAITGDELLQITGEVPAVKKALFQVSSRLHDNPSRSQHLLASHMSHAYQSGGPNVGAPVGGVVPLMDPYGRYKGDAAGDRESYYPLNGESFAKEFGLRMVCPSVNIGAVIGKDGVIIRQIRQESGASVNVDSSAAEDDCIITVSAKEFFEDPVSPTIEAAIRLQPRCSEKMERESGEPSYTTQLLIPQSRTGCLIGKGGSIITHMRRATRANIRILSKGSLPKVAFDDEDLVQIGGDLDVIRNALLQVTTRLRANVFEREGALSSYPSAPYHPMPSTTSVGLSNGRRDGQARGHSYGIGNHGGSQVGDGYGKYGGYTGRSGYTGNLMFYLPEGIEPNNKLSDPTAVSHGQYRGY